MVRPATRDSSSVLIDQITDWLMGEALGEPDIQALIEGTASRVEAAGIPVSRLSVAFTILHPLYRASSITWRRGAKLEVTQLIRSQEASTLAWQQSPLNHMIQRQLTSLRRRLAGPDALLDFPLLKELSDQGGTDYFAFAIPFGKTTHEGLVGSWVTDRKRGFLESDFRALTRIQRRLAVALRMTIRRQVAENVVVTYLGRGAGQRVLAGQIQRGDGETIPAVIWYSDLRGSTAMAERLDRDAYTTILNCYFGCIGGAVMEAGGEILDFIGDAVLAIYPIDGAPEATCKRVLGAAHDAQRRLDGTNLERASGGLPTLTYGLGLHLGEVMFGNIGTPDRLSFSAIGPSVNQVARLESLTKTVGRPIVASRAFMKACGGAWEALGRHAVQGIAEPIEVFAPGRAAATSAAPAVKTNGGRTAPSQTRNARPARRPTPPGAGGTKAAPARSRKD